jgi:ubiquinone/menaquinone biosynthesis C-methylase UbiE
VVLLVVFLPGTASATIDGMSFDRLARFYPAMEFLLAGQKLQRCRLAFLNEAETAKNILLVGEGHGRFLEALLKLNPNARICCVDSSARMLNMAKKQVAAENRLERIQFVISSIEEFQPEQRFDFIATQFFLDCFTEAELARIVPKLAGLLQPAGKWLLCDFQVPAARWRSTRARIVLFLAYSFFRRATGLSARKIVSPQPFLERSGLRRVKRAEFNFGLMYAEMWKKAGPE